MLSMFWDETHHALYESVTRWVEAHLRPHATAWEEAGLFPRELYAAAGAAGLLGVGWPEELGGSGGDIFHRLIVAEGLLRGGSCGTAMGLGSHTIALPPILELGSPEQQERFIPPVLRGERVAALAITEPGAGSDVAGVQLRAVQDGDHYVLDGQKTFITSGTRADTLTVLARTGEGRHDGLSFFVVEAPNPGLRVGRPLQKMGWWASDTAELFFEGCRVPVEHRLGPEGAGFLGAMVNFTAERLLLGATAVAMSAMAIEETERHIAVRRAFDKPIGAFQVTRHKVAEMRTDEASARAFVSVVAERYRRGEDVATEAAMAKNMSAAAVARVTDAAVQLHGGMGYMRECLVERLYRDQRLLSIGGGTSEIMRELIWRRTR